jgi:ligand-binding SRPBCC domain-containing protein
MSTIDVNISRDGRGWVVHTEQVFPKTPDEIFPFFSDAHNLEKITPGFLRFNVLTPRPIDMKSGTIIDYKLKVRGVPIRWRTRIESFDPPRMFVDNQIKGPYQRWHHTHTFQPTPDGKGTIAKDRVEYEPPGWFLKPVINFLFVQRDVKAIFEHRGKVLAEMFG